MKKAKITRIRIETDELVIVRRINIAHLTWCERCAAQTYAATVDEAAALREVSPEEIYQQVEAGRIHLFQNAEGKTLICVRLS